MQRLMVRLGIRNRSMERSVNSIFSPPFTNRRSGISQTSAKGLRLLTNGSRIELRRRLRFIGIKRHRVSRKRRRAGRLRLRETARTRTWGIWTRRGGESGEPVTRMGENTHPIAFVPGGGGVRRFRGGGLMHARCPLCKASFVRKRAYLRAPSPRCRSSWSRARRG